MTYWGSDKSNWGFDRNRRIKLFELLKKNASPAMPQKPSQSNDPSSKPFPESKLSWVIPVLGAILKIAVFIFIFYAFAMILSHGKRWPD